MIKACSPEMGEGRPRGRKREHLFYPKKREPTGFLTEEGESRRWSRRGEEKRDRGA